MDGTSSDNFEYILQLTKILSVECRANRQERDKIEHLFKRLAKQSYLNYEQLNGRVSPRKKELFDKLSTPTEEDVLIRQNYELLKQIELQEYMNNKVWLLINEINGHLSSIKSFVIDRKLAACKDVTNFVDENFTVNGQRLDMSCQVLRNELNVSKERSETVIEVFKSLIQEIDWKLVPKNSKSFINFQSKLKILENRYNVSLDLPI